MSFTYKPKRKKRARTHGFRSRMKSATGRAVLSRRRRKGRHTLTASRKRT
ncbi:MAG: 50S ribosomal protein L34 [bacterium]|nr:50S ribosomal protein L34 [bacterium]